MASWPPRAWLISHQLGQHGESLLPPPSGGEAGEMRDEVFVLREPVSVGIRQRAFSFPTNWLMTNSLGRADSGGGDGPGWGDKISALSEPQRALFGAEERKSSEWGVLGGSVVIMI